MLSHPEKYTLFLTMNTNPRKQPGCLHIFDVDKQREPGLKTKGEASPVLVVSEALILLIQGRFHLGVEVDWVVLVTVSLFYPLIWEGIRYGHRNLYYGHRQLTHPITDHKTQL